MAHDNPVDQVQQLVADARQAFAKDVDDLLAEFTVSWHRNVNGTLTREDWRTFRRILLEKFDQRLPLRSHADPVLLQLVKEAFDVLNDPKSKVDLRDWNREAKKLFCDHKFVDSVACVKCGWLPPAPIDLRD